MVGDTILLSAPFSRAPQAKSALTILGTLKRPLIPDLRQLLPFRHNLSEEGPPLRVVCLESLKITGSTGLKKTQRRVFSGL